MANLSMFVYNGSLDKILEWLDPLKSISASLDSVLQRIGSVLYPSIFKADFSLKPVHGPWSDFQAWNKHVWWFIPFQCSHSISSIILKEGTFYSKKLSTHSRSSLYFGSAVWRKFSLFLKLSGDSEPLVSGAKYIYKKNPKCFFLLVLAESF